MAEDSSNQPGKTPEGGSPIVESGGGAVATGGSVAAGKGGVAIGGDSHAPITIDNSTKNITLAPSETEEQARRERDELPRLRQAVAQKLADLGERAKQPPPRAGNPYLSLQHFSLEDAARFFGRREEIDELLGEMMASQATFLDGNGGVGKTSLILAGLTPKLLEQGHLPLAVSLLTEDIQTAIKKQLLSNVEEMPFLWEMALAEFLRRTTDCLPEGRSLVVMLDDFENFFKLDAGVQERFRSEFLRCVDAAPRAHWLFCLPTDLANLFRFFRPRFDPRSNTYSLLPLDRDGAEEAITRPASLRGVQIDAEVTGDILDALGGTNIQPAQLQVVCHTLAGGRGKLVSAWTMGYYREQGQAEGILREYLDRTIESLDDDMQEVAWEMLAVLSEARQKDLTETRLAAVMQEDYGVASALSGQVLSELEESQLVERGRTLRLASDSLRPRIGQWIAERSAREKMHQEFVEQLHSIRNSSLRGLLGGAIGFVLVDQLLAKPLPDISYKIFSVLLVASIGAIAGLLAIFSVDLSLASYTGPRKWLAYLVGGLSGAFAFALATIMYANLNYSGATTFISLLPRAAIEGGLWGLVAIAGTVWVLSARRPVWITVPAVAILCGLVLLASDAALGILKGAGGLAARPATIALAGIFFPALILLAALLGHRDRLGGTRP